MTSPRKAHIDICKFLGMTLVVLGHNPALLSERSSHLYHAIYSFHVPLFFFLSGLFLSTRQGLVQQLTTRIDSLLKPYFFISLLLISKEFLLESLNWAYVAGVFYGNGLTIDWIPMWFLTHLFVASFVSYLVISFIFPYIESFFLRIAVSLVVLLLGSMFIKSFWLEDGIAFGQERVPGLPFSVDILAVTVPYLLLGFLIKRYVLEFKENHILGLISLAVFLVLNSTSIEDMDLNLRSYGNFFIVNLKVFCSLYVVFYLSSVLSKIPYVNELFSYFGKASIFILIFHFVIQSWIYKSLLGVVDSTALIATLSFFPALLAPVFFYWVFSNNSLLSPLMLPVKQKQANIHSSAIPN